VLNQLFFPRCRDLTMKTSPDRKKLRVPHDGPLKIVPRKPAPCEFVPRKALPCEFVLDALDPLMPRTRLMFGCVAVYVREKIVLALREKAGEAADNGVWLATTEEHHESLRRDFPNMRSIGVLGKGVTGWQVLPSDAPDFEEAALRACELIAAKDPRIGKVPKGRTRRVATPAKTARRAK
jgi:hypothetical protein